MTSRIAALPQLVPNRVEAVLRRIQSQVWKNATEVAVTACKPTQEHRGLAQAMLTPRKPMQPGAAWGRLYEQRWFHLKLSLPRGERPLRYLEWRDLGEATLWVKRTPFYGFDVAHRRVALPPGTRDAWVEAYCCQSAIWHPEARGLSPQGSVFSGAFLVERDDVAWKVAMDLQSLFDLLLHLRSQQQPAPPRELARVGQQPGVEQATPVYRRLLWLLSRVCDAFERDGLPAAELPLEAALREMKDAKPRIQAVLTGHAHIDLVWLWPERMGEAKAVHTFSTVNRLMELYPEFRFAYSQPASYRAVEQRAPGLAGAVRRRIRSGQWEATGAMDVESDTLLPCGEALARSLLLGQEEFVRLRGSAARLLWLPDVFGYSACLPQLMRLCGVEWFFTTKLTWSAVTRFPFSSFVWRGNDGSEVLAHVTQSAGYNNRLDLTELDANARGHVQADVHPEFLHPTGYGDGGGGPTEEMCERARRLNALAGTPALAWDQPEAFFQRLADKRALLPAYQGEFYLEYHRGTYTTHGDLKAAFRGLERALQLREAVAVAKGSAPRLTEVWRRLVFAQFHDYIPGSSVYDVYAEGVPELRRLAHEQLTDATAELSAKSGQGSWRVFNPLPQTWRGWMTPPQGGAPLWLQLPPLAGVQPTPAAESPPRVEVSASRLANGRVAAEIGPDGWLRRLRIDGRDVEFAGPAAVAVLYPDQPANYDAWDIDRHSLDLGQVVTTLPRIQVVRPGEESASIEVTRRIGNKSTMTVRFRLDGGAAVLRIETEVDWQETQTLLKLQFPTRYRGQHARFGAPFGSVLRGQQAGVPSVEAQWEVPGSRWAAVSFDGERQGLAVITEAKYGFSARDGELTVSLLRAARITGCDDHRYAAPPGLNTLQPPSPFSDQGRHTIRLAVTTYDACGPAEQHPAALADTLFTEPQWYRGPEVAAGLLEVANAPTLIPAWAMPAQRNAWVLRLHEASGQAGEAELKLAAGWRAEACRLDGSPVHNPQAQSTRFGYGAYQILSIRIVRATV